MKMKRSLSLLLCLVMVLSLAAGCGGKTGGGSSDTVKISWWIGKGEDSTYYMSYDENPAVKYLETKEYNGKKIDLSFVVPISGAELDNFNTLLMTDEYCSLMDMSRTTTYPAELYQDGYIWDLTPYMEQYMPNYMKILEENSDLKPMVCSNVDGEKKYLSLYQITPEPLGNFKGFLYRRDWLSKYGTNPETGAAFTYGYTDPADYNTYYDDVVFPSGGADPVYISDWEWMFGIFDLAMADLGITDGYCTSLYYKGYNEDGMVCNAFGGNSPLWYRGQDGNAYFGGDQENLRVYLECMNNWYNKGWLDKGFAEHTSDAAYAIDSPKVHMGKVGLWQGRRSETGGQMDIGDAYTSGIMVYGARSPINDVYGDASVQGQTPFCMYQESRLKVYLTVSKKVSEEDLPTVLTFLDSLYAPEGAALVCFGLTQEQFEETQDATYVKYNLTEGAYHTETNADGSTKYIRDEKLLADNDLASAMAGKRLSSGAYGIGFKDALMESYVPCARNAMNEWDYYKNTGFPEGSLRTQFTEDESNVYSKTYANIDAYMSSTLPKFITGDLDYTSDADWGNYCKMLNKYAPNKVTAIYQRIYDSAK